MVRTFYQAFGTGSTDTNYHGWLVGPTVNSLITASSGWSIANAITFATRSGEIPYFSYTPRIASDV
jgi:hypothetical protein